MDKTQQVPRRSHLLQTPSNRGRVYAAKHVTGGSRRVDGWTGVYGLKLDNLASPGNLWKALSFSLLQWLILLKGGRGHSTPVHERLRFQSLFRQYWNKMSLVNHTASPQPLRFQPRGFPKGWAHCPHPPLPELGYLPSPGAFPKHPLHLSPSPKLQLNTLRGFYHGLLQCYDK